MLTVGSDCAIGKKTVAVELDLEARRRGLESVFVPTGQTGIAIAGWGIAVDAVVADFLAGAAEQLVVEGAARGGRLLFVEGQGSLVHPLYSGVTLGLMHGSAPHAFVLCHRAGATEIDGSPGHPIPPLAELVELHERMRSRVGARRSCASRSTRPTSTRTTTHVPRSKASRPRLASPRTTRCASAQRLSLTPSWREFRLRQPGQRGARGNHSNATPRCGNGPHRRAPGRGGCCPCRRCGRERRLGEVCRRPRRLRCIARWQLSASGRR